ncbi:DUF4064 domain-containing protein [Alkalihalophilus pseudofirmus]|uniref:DUF4064 domain-containing protein n=1 Tax=Alkalihalophilus pseudofirmus TaxID=79885 RepID=A0AAJ2KZR2_ALKPS|nr:DUF4064 domain-containing protein [Alkalihalophilus pseudofirmus]MDV2884938.1 DUF4064 domain-containing protein [Alkalihalophilus pseudofirmus]WEG15272.1 DUF4064 domain-containing protein [Alkalihalophilus pseudofirmus]
MNKKHMMIRFISVISLGLLVGGTVFLLSIGPLEQHQGIRSVVIDLYQMDPKVQRDTLSGTLQIQPDEFATDTLQYINQYMYLPIGALILSAVLTVVSLFILNKNSKMSGSLFMFAAAASCFTVIPPIMQVISGSLLLKGENGGRELKAESR